MRTIDSPTIGWIRKTARQHYWRVARWYDLDDLIQDGVLHYYRILRRYPDISDKRHLMGLFKRAYHNHLNDLSNDRTRQLQLEVLSADISPLEEPDFVLEHYRDPRPTDSEFSELFMDAPSWVREVIRMLIEHPRELRKPLRCRNDGTRETVNERWQWLTDYEPGINLPKLIRAYLVSRGA